MDITSYVSELTNHIVSTPPLAVPKIIMNTYVEYLWNYEANSWVAKIAYSARVLAIIVSLPIVILGLLDIASYGIARTLGIVDDVKASTSDKITRLAPDQLPGIQINGDTPSESSTSTETDLDHNSVSDQVLLRNRRRATSILLAASKPQVYYASETNSLKLSGADVFSPAASEPPSPTISRRSTSFLNSK